MEDRERIEPPIFYPVPKKIKPKKTDYEKIIERNNRQRQKQHDKLTATFGERECVRIRDRWQCIICGKDYSRLPRPDARDLLEVHHVMGRWKKYMHDIRFQVCVCGWKTEKYCHDKAGKHKIKLLKYLMMLYPEIIEDKTVQKLLKEESK